MNRTRKETPRLGAICRDVTGVLLSCGYACSSAGDVNFEPVLKVLSDGEPTRLAIGDFDNDSDNDVAVLIPGPDPKALGMVQIFLNVGNGILNPHPNTIDVGPDPTGIAVGLFDMGEHVDLAVSNAADDTVFVLFGNGDGTFQIAVPIGGFDRPSAITAVDYDEDGLFDLAITNENANTATILRNLGAGNFDEQEAATAGVGPLSIEPECLLGDAGAADFAGINRDEASGEAGVNGSLFVLIQNLDGTFGPATTFPVGANPKHLAIGDSNDDGTNDIFVVNADDDTVTLRLNDGAGGFGTFFTLDVGGDPRAIQVPDLAELDPVGDGDADMIIIADDPMIGPAVQVWENVFVGGDPLFEVTAFDTGGDPAFVVVEHMDGDLCIDIIVVNADGEGGGSVSVLQNLPPTCFGEEDVIDQPWDGVTAGVVAQVFPDLPDFDSFEFDDFSTESSVRITTLEAPGTETGDMGANIDVVAEIWDGLPGGFGGSIVMSSVSGFESADGTLMIDFDGQNLLPGDYWITAYVVRESAGGQWFWNRTNDGAPNDSEQFFYNPGGGFGFGAEPIPGSRIHGTPADMSFVLRGCSATTGSLGDMDGDGAVGTGDLIFLLGSWGDPYGTADLIELLGNWGPCE